MHTCTLHTSVWCTSVHVSLLLCLIGHGYLSSDLACVGGQTCRRGRNGNPLQGPAHSGPLGERLSFDFLA